MKTFMTVLAGPAARAVGNAASVAVAGLAFATLAAQAQVPSNPYSYTRTSSFTYQANGLLQSETIEPDETASCVTTSYGYDAQGNKNSTTTSNCGGATGNAVFAARSASSAYANVPSQSITVAGAAVTVAVPAGLFATGATNALGHSETRSYDPRFGAVLTLTGPNTLTTTFQVDDFGRQIKETRADGTSTVAFYCVLSGKGLDTTANSAGCGSTASLSGISGEIPSDAVSYVHSEPRDTGNAKMGPASRVYSDRAGRKLREVSEAFDGAGQPATRRFLAKDTQYNTQGVAVLSTQPYFLGVASSTLAGNADMGMTMTVYDALGRPTQVDVADPQGSVANVNFNGLATRTSARTYISYSGLVTSTTNPKGQQRYEEKNVDGKLVRVSDTTGAQIAYQHDAFGNLLQTKDALQNLVKVDYDIRGRKVSMTDPDTGLWQYAYNALGELVWQQSANQRAATPVQATTMAYDRLGRMTSRTEPEYTSTWSYDTYIGGGACTRGIGKLCESNTSHGINKKIVYDSLGRPSSARTTVSTGPSFASLLTYQASTGRLDTQTFPTGAKVNYTYTALGFVSQLRTTTPITLNPLPATAGGAAGASTSLPANTVLWSAGSVNAWGKAETQSLGNGVVSRAAFEAATGRVTSASAGAGSATNVLNHTYTWDSLTRLSGRTDANGDGNTGAVSETFLYDTLNRLKEYTVAAPQVPNLARTVVMTYNAIGNITSKSDVGTYTYTTSGNTGGVSNPRPHAVQSVTGAVGSVSYTHDANGNLTVASSGKYRSIAYTSFNLPDSNSGAAGASGSPRYTWQYDENHQRIRETHVDASGTRTTWYQHPDNQGGLGFESETAANGAVSNRHYLSAGSQTVVMVSTGALPTLAAGATTPPTLASITLVKVEYWHKDHLGSLAATTDHLGAVTARYAYDPFGKRRMTNGRYDEFGTLVIDWASNVNTGTDRGFTGHEQLDDLGIVHMNGRLYDPLIGRFMQGDPLIQAADDLQSYNRYSYCINNVLNCTDPSGYSWLSKTWKKIWHNKVVRTVIIVVVAYYTGGYALDAYASSQAATAGYAAASSASAAGLTGAELAAAESFAYSSAYSAAASSVTGGAIAGAAGGFAGNFVGSNGDLKAGIQGAISGALSGGVNNYYGSSYTAGRIMANGTAGGMGAVLRGDSFSRGFRSSATISSLSYLNAQMRNEMIEQSKIDIRNDGSGLSQGMNGDEFKLAGGRFNFLSTPGECSPLGCDQRGPGKVFGFSYAKGGVVDMVLESFAGPHDKANSPWFYDATTGNIKDFSDWTNFQKRLLEATTNYTTSLLFAAPFAASSIFEQSNASRSLSSTFKKSR